MVHIGEWLIKSVKVAAQSSVTVAIKGRTYLAGDGLNRNFFAVEFSLSIVEVVHFLSYPQISLTIIVLVRQFN